MANRDAPNTTIVERGGSGGTVLIGIALLLAVIVGAYFLLSQSHNDAVRTDAVTKAADKVGDGATKVGDAASKAASDTAK
jgi:uncharacterized protein (UPF0333 family)